MGLKKLWTALSGRQGHQDQGPPPEVQTLSPDELRRETNVRKAIDGAKKFSLLTYVRAGELADEGQPVAARCVEVLGQMVAKRMEYGANEVRLGYMQGQYLDFWSADNDTLEPMIEEQGGIPDKTLRALVKAELVIISNEVDIRRAQAEQKIEKAVSGGMASHKAGPR